jgi:hypothetical protein
MTPDEIEAKKAAPGPEGALARLLLALPINNLEPWVEGEIIRNTNHYDIARCIAEWCSGAIFGLALKSDSPETVIRGRGVHRGMLDLIDISLTKKLNRHVHRKTQGGLFLPPDTMDMKKQ